MKVNKMEEKKLKDLSIKELVYVYDYYKTRERYLSKKELKYLKEIEEELKRRK